MRHKLIGYIFKMAAQHPKFASDSLEKIPDNIALSFLPDFESLSKKALEKGLIISPKVISTILKFRKHVEPCVWMQDVGGQ
jgi:hypothetical protein